MFPYDFKKIRKIIKIENKFDISQPDKVVVIGDQLTTDIIFGNLSGMKSIWVNKPDPDNL